MALASQIYQQWASLYIMSLKEESKEVLRSFLYLHTLQAR